MDRTDLALGLKEWDRRPRGKPEAAPVRRLVEGGQRLRLTLAARRVAENGYLSPDRGRGWGWQHVLTTRGRYRQASPQA